MDKIKLKEFAFEKANDITLAKEYYLFLSESKNEQDLEIRTYCLDKRPETPISAIKELYAYFSD